MTKTHATELFSYALWVVVGQSIGTILKGGCRVAWPGLEYCARDRSGCLVEQKLTLKLFPRSSLPVLLTSGQKSCVAPPRSRWLMSKCKVVCYDKH